MYIRDDVYTHLPGTTFQDGFLHRDGLRAPVLKMITRKVEPQGVWMQRCFFGASLLVLHILFPSQLLDLPPCPTAALDGEICLFYFLEALNQGDLIFLPKSLSSDRGNLL